MLSADEPFTNERLRIGVALQLVLFLASLGFGLTSGFKPNLQRTATISTSVLNLCFSFLHSWQVCRACAPLHDDSNTVQEANGSPADKAGAPLRLLPRMSDLARRAWPFRKLNQARSLELIKIAMVGLLHISSLIGYGVSNGAWYLQVSSCASTTVFLMLLGLVSLWNAVIGLRSRPPGTPREPRNPSCWANTSHRSLNTVDFYLSLRWLEGAKSDQNLHG